MHNPQLPDLKITQPPETLREIVQEKLRSAIIEGHFKPGDRLVERPLCDQLGVSRTVVRETIRFLEAEGLVAILPNKGPIVAKMDRDQARQIYDIREMLETAAAVACADAPTPELHRRLSAALAQIQTAYTPEPSGALLNATTAFYNVIFQEAGQSIALEVVQRLNARISWLRLLTLSATDRKGSGLTHMRRIHDAIISGDKEGAARAVHCHLKEASAIADRVLAKAESSSNPDRGRK